MSKSPFVWHSVNLLRCPRNRITLSLGQAGAQHRQDHHSGDKYPYPQGNNGFVHRPSFSVEQTFHDERFHLCSLIPCWFVRLSPGMALIGPHAQLADDARIRIPRWTMRIPTMHPGPIANVLGESLRDAHPVITAIWSWCEGSHIITTHTRTANPGADKALGL